MKKRKNKNILCLEGNWDGYILEPKSGMKSLLDFITINSGTTYSYNFINTPTELKYVIDSVDVRNFSMIYLGFHGDPEKINMGRYGEFSVSLWELAEIFGKRFENYCIHFASCAVLNTDNQQIETFKNMVGAKFVSGYNKYVDFGDSSVIDLAFITDWINSKSYGLMFKKLQKKHDYIIKENGFKYYI